MAVEVGVMVSVKREPQDYAAVCGLYWAGSAWYEVLEATCGTQSELEGELVNLCPVYACARVRGVAHCGVCPEFPCQLLTNLASVTPGDRRIESAALRAELGEERWAEWARGQHLWLAFCPLRDRTARVSHAVSG